MDTHGEDKDRKEFDKFKATRGTIEIKFDDTKAAILINTNGISSDNIIEVLLQIIEELQDKKLFNLLTKLFS